MDKLSTQTLVSYIISRKPDMSLKEVCIILGNRYPRNTIKTYYYATKKRG